MKPVSRRAPANDQGAILLRSHKRLREASLQAMRLMDRMKEEGALRLPFLGYDEAMEALRKALG